MNNNPDEPKYMGMPGAKTTMYNAQSVLTAGSYMCVTEGELDTVVLSVKTGHPSIGIPGANNWKPYYTKILDDFETVIVLADGDNAGLEFGKKLSRELPNVNLLQMPEGHDVNSIIIQEGKEWIDERENVSDETQEFWEFIKDNKQIVGIPVSNNSGLDLLSALRDVHETISSNPDGAKKMLTLIATVIFASATGESEELVNEIQISAAMEQFDKNITEILNEKS